MRLERRQNVKAIAEIEPQPGPSDDELEPGPERTGGDEGQGHAKGLLGTAVLKYRAVAGKRRETSGLQDWRRGRPQPAWAG